MGKFVRFILIKINYIKIMLMRELWDVIFNYFNSFEVHEYLRVKVKAQDCNHVLHSYMYVHMAEYM